MKRRTLRYMLITIISFLIMSCLVNVVTAEKTEVVQFFTKVKLTTIKVYEDNDDFGQKGEIYCISNINEDEYRTRTINDVDNGDELTYNEELYSNWCSYLNIVIQVWDEDINDPIPSDPDRMGSAYFDLFPDNITIWYETYDPDDKRLESNVTICVYTLGSRIQTINNNGFSIILPPVVLLCLFFFKNYKSKKTVSDCKHE